MATRQYIGARYVPKFFDYNGSSNWRSGTEYEALTIVTLNGNSYTSKIPVPSSVGSPDQNPDYWVATGLYNQQVEAYRQLTIAVADRVTDVENDLTTAEGDIDNLESDVSGLGTRLTNAEGDIDNLESDMSGLGTRLTTAEGDIDNLESDVSGLGTRLTTAEGDIDNLESSRELNLSARKFLFVGDSYIASHSDTCVEKACAALGITNYTNVSVSGASFHSGGFLSQITNYSGDKTAITDIFVIGGINDAEYESISEAAPLTASITTFIQYVKENYPNAKITVCFSGHALENSSVLANRTWKKRYWANWVYKNNFEAAGYLVRSNMWEALCANTTFLSSDKLHPSSIGQEELSRFLIAYILGNDTNELRPPLTAGAAANIFYYFMNHKVIITSQTTAVVVNSVAGETITGNGMFIILDDLPFYVNETFQIPYIFRAVNANNIPHTMLRGYLVVGGNRIVGILNELNDNGWQNYVFSNQGNITLDRLTIEIPTTCLL